LEAQYSILVDRLARIEEALSLLRHRLPPPVLKPSEVARILRVSEQTVKTYIERGELVALTLVLGNGVRVYRVADKHLEAFLNGRICKHDEKTNSSDGDAARWLRVPRNLV
jgi:hypothetical protein